MSKEQITSLQPAPSPPDEVILNVNLTGADRPMKIKVSQTIFERMTEALEERGLKPEFVAAGAVIFVAAATTAGIVVAKKAIERRRERQTQKIRTPVLNEEQKREYDLMWDSSHEKIFSYIRLKVGNYQDAEDLTQDVFRRAYQHFPPRFTYPDLPNRYLPWLYRIAHNVVSNSYRDTQKEREKSGGPIEDEEIFPRPRMMSDLGSVIVLKEEAAELQRTIASLQHPYPLVLWLRSALHLSNKEIADILGKTEGGIKSIFHRARGKLKEVYNFSNFRDGP